MENYNSKLSVEKIFYLFSEPDYLIWCNLLQGNNSFLFEKKSEFTHTKFARSVLTVKFWFLCLKKAIPSFSQHITFVFHYRNLLKSELTSQ